MHFVVIVPLWLGLLFVAIKMLVNLNQKKMVQRTIKAPDGREATFIVSQDEPAHVTIERMTPNDNLEQREARLLPAVLPEHRAYFDNLPVIQPTKETSVGVAIGKTILAICGVILLLGLMKTCSDQTSTSTSTTPSTSNASAGAIESTQPPLRSTSTPQPYWTIRLKTDGNIRVGPTKLNSVVRVARNGEMLRAFESASGWTRVGTVSPEGWLADSTFIRVGN